MGADSSYIGQCKWIAKFVIDSTGSGADVTSPQFAPFARFWISHPSLRAFHTIQRARLFYKRAKGTLGGLKIAQELATRKSSGPV